MSSYRRLVVTGHLGFIGSMFCEAFHDRYEMFGVDFSGWGSMPENLAPGVTDIRADIADGRRDRGRSCARSALMRSSTSPPRVTSIAPTKTTRSSGSRMCSGARNLALEAGRHRRAPGPRLHRRGLWRRRWTARTPWTETSADCPEERLRGDAKPRPRCSCGSTPRAGQHNLDLVVTRGANTIGPRQFPEKAVPKAISCFLSARPFPLFQTPARRMWMHAEDHAAGIEAALLRGKRGEVYNLAPDAASEMSD